MKYLLVIYSSFQRVQRQNTPIGSSCIAVGNVGLTGARGYMYYVEVTPDQKVGLSIVSWRMIMGRNTQVVDLLRKENRLKLLKYRKIPLMNS